MAYLFNENCDGCSACERQCPTAAIYGERRKWYAVDPVLCIDCGVCGMICPVEAVLDEHGQLAARLPRNKRERPVVDPAMCNGCGLCIDYCPYACLSLVGHPQAGISILSEPLACVSCAECVDVCIKGAVKMRALNLREFDVDVETSRCLTVLDVYQEAK